MRRQFGDLIFQVLDVLVALVGLGEMGVFEGGRSVRTAWEIHDGSLEIKYYNNIQYYSLLIKQSHTVK
jgi:hypothetical protein